MKVELPSADDEAGISQFIHECLARVPDAAGRADFAPGQILYREGDRAHCVHWVESGCVAISMLTPQGRVCVVDMVGPSRLTGEECLGSAAFHSATAQAVSASHIVSIRRDDVLRLMRSVAGVSERIVESLLQARLRVHQRVMAQQSLQAQCRFATMLWDIAVPVPGSRSRVIGVPLTHERLAELLGTTRPRVTVLMNRFMRLGYVHESGGQLVINPSISVATNPRRGAPKRGDALRGILDSIRASDPFVRSGDQGD